MLWLWGMWNYTLYLLDSIEIVLELVEKPSLKFQHWFLRLEERLLGSSFCWREKLIQHIFLIRLIRLSVLVFSQEVELLKNLGLHAVRELREDLEQWVEVIPWLDFRVVCKVDYIDVVLKKEYLKKRGRLRNCGSWLTASRTHRKWWNCLHPIRARSRWSTRRWGISSSFWIL